MTYVNNSRRALLLGTGAALTTGLISSLPVAFASSPKFLTLVEIANFWCSRCFAVNAHFARIQQAAYQAKMDVVFAPATWEGQTHWPGKVYYSMRSLYPEFEPLVRDTLFQGIHTEGQLFETLSQIRQYFERKGVLDTIASNDSSFAWQEVAVRADSDAPMQSEGRVSRLIDWSGIEAVPGFLWLGDGKLDAVLSPSEAAEAGQLVALVVRKLDEYAKTGDAR